MKYGNLPSPNYRELLSVTADEVADLLDGTGAWLQMDLARDWLGKPCPPQDTEACKFCLLGAIEHVAGNNLVSADLVMEIEETINDELTMWNDAEGRTQAEVVQVVRDTATRLKES